MNEYIANMDKKPVEGGGMVKRQRDTTDAETERFLDKAMMAMATLSQLAEVDSSSPHQASSSSSPPSAAAMEFAQACLRQSPPAVCAAGAAESSRATDSSADQTEVTVLTSSSCETFTCVGGTWLGGKTFEPCVKRKQTDGVRHAKSMVCTVHHLYVKCNSCPARIHEGCHAPCPTGFSLPQRTVPWKCLQCTLEHNASALDTKAEVLKPEGDEEGGASKEKAISKCVFETYADLQDHVRQTNWKIRSSKPGTATCICGVNPKFHTPCTVKFHLKRQKCNTDDPDGPWCAINMPSEHACGGGKRTPMPVTSRVCNLPIQVYMEIQNLACCKAFKPANIQVYINQKHGMIVDTTLIYNIGYRARAKLGIGDMEKLYSQQKVRVYTFSTSSTISNLILSQARQAAGDMYEFVYHMVDGENRLK
jgi:hypothetical protein